MNDTQELNEFLNVLHESDGFYMKTGLEETKRWFEVAIPEPTPEQACIQVGCHYEEVAEMMEATGDGFEMEYVNDLSKLYKLPNQNCIDSLLLNSQQREPLLDSLVDQIVTAVGVGHMLGMDVLGALSEVNRSNFSKFENGKAVFNAQGKITKGKHYSPPDLKPFI